MNFEPWAKGVNCFGKATLERSAGIWSLKLHFVGWMEMGGCTIDWMPDLLKDTSPWSPYHSSREWRKTGTDMPIVSIMVMLQGHVMEIVVVSRSGGDGLGMQMVVVLAD